jgi:hypothetical protein
MYIGLPQRYINVACHRGEKNQKLMEKTLIDRESYVYLNALYRKSDVA